MVSLRLSVGLVILLMLCSLAPENAIQYVDLHVVTLKFGLRCLLSKLACMYGGFSYNVTSYLHKLAGLNLSQTAIVSE